MHAVHPIVPGPTPPSTWISLLGNRMANIHQVGESARAGQPVQGLDSHHLPGTTVMTSNMSTELPSASEMADEGVPGEMATAARMPVEWISWTTSCAFSSVDEMV